jgi:hypothetical protein
MQMQSTFGSVLMQCLKQARGELFVVQMVKVVKNRKSLNQPREIFPAFIVNFCVAATYITSRAVEILFKLI